MNIYKRLYPLIRTELRNFGQKLKNIKYTDTYWLEILGQFKDNNENQNNWDRFFSEYLYYSCNEEDCKFIDLYIFKENNINYVSTHFPLSERACQEWRKEQYKNIIGLAMQEGLLHIDIKVA